MNEMLQITFNDSAFYTKSEYDGSIVNKCSQCDCRDDCSGVCDCIRDNRC